MADDHRDEQLFAVDVTPLETEEETPTGGVNKTFRRYDPHQQFLVPPSLDDWLPENHLARFVSDLVEEVIDLEPFLASYKEVRGFPPYDPRLMLKILLYGYSTGVRSSRAIEKSCSGDVAFRWLAANEAPDFRSIARFRRRHLVALRELFRTSLLLCKEAGMVRLGTVALDGTKVRANASRRKAMSYRYLSEKEQILAAEVDDLLHDAEVTHAREDKALGKDKRDEDLPEELVRREHRLEVMRRAKADLEARARNDAADKARKLAADKGLVEEMIEEHVAVVAANATPKPTAQASFTDPDARIMKTADGSFHYCYNAQAEGLLGSFIAPGAWVAADSDTDGEAAEGLHQNAPLGRSRAIATAVTCSMLATCSRSAAVPAAVIRYGWRRSTAGSRSMNPNAASRSRAPYNVPGTSVTFANPSTSLMSA